MFKFLRMLTIMSFVAMSLGACISNGTAGGLDLSSNRTWGGLLGAAGGGLLGSQVGDRGSNAQLIGTAVGTLVGLGVGGQIGNSIDQTNAMYNNPAYVNQQPTAYPAAQYPAQQYPAQPHPSQQARPQYNAPQTSQAPQHPTGQAPSVYYVYPAPQGAYPR